MTHAREDGTRSQSPSQIRKCCRVCCHSGPHFLAARAKRKPRCIHQMPKTGASCSRPFSDLFNVAASRSAQMTTREDSLLASAKSSIIAFRLSTKGGARNKCESYARWSAPFLPPPWPRHHARPRNRDRGENPSLNRRRSRMTMPTNQEFDRPQIQSCQAGRSAELSRRAAWLLRRLLTAFRTTRMLINHYDLIIDASVGRRYDFR